MSGFGTRYLSPFAVALGAGNTFMSLFATLPTLIAGLFQILTLKSFYDHSRKKVVMFSVAAQIIFWLPLVFCASLFYYDKISVSLSLIILFLSYTLLSIFGALASPSWNSWMRDLVPKKSGNYFGKRTAIIGTIGIISMVIGGIILDFFKKSSPNKLMIGFSVIFIIAIIGRSVSLSFFRKQYEPKHKSYKSSYFSFFSFIKNIEKHGNNFGKFSVFIGIFGLGVAIASPFFSVYMLKDIGFSNSYLSYTIISIVSLASIMAFSPSWGRIIDKHGNVAVMKFCSIGIAFVPLLWAFSFMIYNNFGFSVTAAYLFFIEIFTGFVWGGYNLSSAVFIYEAVTKEKMALCVAYNGIIGAAGAVIGSIIGRIMMNYSGPIPILGNVNYFVFVFLISFVARLTIAIFFSSTFKEVRKVKKASLNLKDVQEAALYPLTIIKKYTNNHQWSLFHPPWKAI